MAMEQGSGDANGVSQIVADVNSGMMKLVDMIGGKFPEDAQKLAGIAQQYQQFVDGLGQAQGAEPTAAQGLTTPEAGAAQVRPAM